MTRPSEVFVVFISFYIAASSKVLIGAFYSSPTVGCLRQRSMTGVAVSSWSPSQLISPSVFYVEAASSSPSPHRNTISSRSRASNNPTSHLHFTNHENEIDLISLSDQKYLLRTSNFTKPITDVLSDDAAANNLSTKYIFLRQKTSAYGQDLNTNGKVKAAANVFLPSKVTINCREQNDPIIKGKKRSLGIMKTKGRPWSEVEGYAATDVHTLRKIFGTNKNRWWGDLDAETARILYHTLLPRALIRLHAQGLEPEALAPLAYEARLAAKRYARERCQVPARVLAVAYDGLRHLKRYGKWSSDGLSWDQLWAKYESQIMQEQRSDSSQLLIKTQVSLRILESSCKTSKVVDKIVLRGGSHSNKKKSDVALEVLAVANKLDREIHELLEKQSSKLQLKGRAREFFLMRLVVQTRKNTRNSTFLTEY